MNESVTTKNVYPAPYDKAIDSHPHLVSDVTLFSPYPCRFFKSCFPVGCGGSIKSLPAVRGIPLRQGKQRVWDSTANGGVPPHPYLSGANPPKPPLFVTPFYMKRGKSLCKHLITSSSILGIFWYERKTLYLEILKERGN